MRNIKNILNCFVWFVVAMSACYGDIYADDSSHKTEWKLTKTIPLDYIAETTYNHTSYVRMIALYNELDPDQRASEGSTIKTPVLQDLFKDLGLIPTYEKQFERILSIIKEYRAILPEYRKLREKANGYYKSGQMQLPKTISDQFILLASMLEKTVSDIEDMTRTNGNTPKMMLRQLKHAARELRGLAAGNMDGYGYDQDMVEQHIAQALANAVVWARE